MISPSPSPCPDAAESGRPQEDLRSAAWAVIAAFGTYFSMYLFRKPFTAATYAEMSAWGIDLKTLLVASQVAGYFLSKVIGIKLVSETPPHRRVAAIIGLVLVAEVALLLFGAIPAPWNVPCLFLNGLPLGMVFGLVVLFLEGRRLTEFLAAGLCISFIVADGAAKSLGQWLLDRHVSPFWMPGVAGLVGLVPLSFFAWMLSRIPPPTAADVEARSHRSEMTAADRRGLCARHAVGLAAILVAYLLTTILRSIRADFAAELWQGLGYTNTPELFSVSEMLIAAGVLLASGLTVVVQDNHRAFFLSLGTCGAGFVLLLAALAAWEAGRLTGFAAMVLFGLSLYLPYVTVHTTVFERLLAMTREKGTIAFLLTLADSAGYLGYIGVMIGRSLVAKGYPLLHLFEWTAGLASMVSIACLIVAATFFRRRTAAPAPLAAAVVQ